MRIGVGNGSSGVIAPTQYAGLTYRAAPPPIGFGTSGSATTPIGGASAGYLADFGRFVLGAEAQLEFGTSTASGTALVSYDTSSVTTCPPFYGCPLGTLSGTANDRLSVRTSLGTSGSLRVRAGVPVGDKALLSVFAGPSFAAARISADQASAATRQYIVVGGYHLYAVQAPLSATAQASRAQTLVGGTFGVALDDRIAAHWLLHAEYGVAVYPSLTVHLPAGAGTASRASFQPVPQAIRVGVAYQF